MAVDGTGNAAIVFGEPFSPVVDNPRSRNDEYLNLDILGSGGDIVCDVLHVSGSNTTIPRSTKTQRTDYPKEPAFRIVTSDGEVVHSGSFEYG